MIRCAECGYLGEYTGARCPSCGKEFTLTEEQLEKRRQEIDLAMKRKDYPYAVECYHILADMGDMQAQKELASLLERGDLVGRDPDRAMHYFYKAAIQGDVFSAYRYSRLVGRHSERAQDLWLAFSAIMGCKSAYSPLAERLSASGREDEANYFYALAAAHDDTDAIVTLAKRYYSGVGAEKNEAFAKWYMDKLTLPPIHAIKLAYRIRGVKAEEPPAPCHPDLDRMLRRLAAMAKEQKYKTVEAAICSMLADRGDNAAAVNLSKMLMDGDGIQRDTEKAISLLKSAAANESAEANKLLGDLYVVGKAVTPDTERALSYYRRAADLGISNAYESMGDIYCEGELVERNIPEAIRLYDLAAAEGHESARGKSDSLKSAREEYYRRAEAALRDAPEEAFKSYLISDEMGYAPATLGLALCYRDGIGTRVNRRAAFRLFEKARELREDRAIFHLGLCYAKGIGTAFNFKKARELLLISARLGSEEATAELKCLLERKKKRMTQGVYSRAMRLLHEKKFAEAREELEACVALSHGKGIYTLGCLCEFGLGIPTDRERAFALYEQAFSLKFRDPRAVYKQCVLRKSKY